MQLDQLKSLVVNDERGLSSITFKGEDSAVEFILKNDISKCNNLKEVLQLLSLPGADCDWQEHGEFATASWTLDNNSTVIVVCIRDELVVVAQGYNASARFMQSLPQYREFYTDKVSAIEAGAFLNYGGGYICFVCQDREMKLIF